MIDPTLVWGAVLAFAAIGAAVVRAAARGNTGTAADYYLGGRRLGGMVSGPSYAATTYSAFMLVVLTGLATCRNQIRPVADIMVQYVLRVLEPIWQHKTETAKRLRGRIENVLSWATVVGYRAGDNPARWKGNLSEILPKPAKVAKSGNQPSLALGDVAEWWAAFGQREGMAAQALQFLTLTAKGRAVLV